MKLRIALEVDIADMTTLEFAALVSRISAALGVDRMRVKMRLAR